MYVRYIICINNRLRVSYIYLFRIKNDPVYAFLYTKKKTSISLVRARAYNIVRALLYCRILQSKLCAHIYIYTHTYLRQAAVKNVNPFAISEKPSSFCHHTRQKKNVYKRAFTTTTTTTTVHRICATIFRPSKREYLLYPCANNNAIMCVRVPGMWCTTVNSRPADTGNLIIGFAYNDEK